MQSSRLRLSAIAVTLMCALALPAPAGAQLLDHKDLTASIAMTIVQTAIETCKANGYAVSATVVGRNGEIIVQVRGDNTAPHTIENSFRKAYTARTFRSPSGALVERVKAEPTLGLIHLTNVIANQGRCRSRWATRSSARRAHRARRAAKRTRRASRRGSTR